LNARLVVDRRARLECKDLHAGIIAPALRPVLTRLAQFAGSSAAEHDRGFFALANAIRRAGGGREIQGSPWPCADPAYSAGCPSGRRAAMRST
jgi:hypothetical protein